MTSFDTILVVDDDKVNILLAKKLLQDSFIVRTALSGEAAFEILKTERPSLILLDIRMPGMDGFEVISKLKDNPELSDIPVIFLTSEDGVDVEVRGFKSGAVDFIRKPFVEEITFQRINRTLERDRLQKEFRHQLNQEVERAIRRRAQMESFITDLAVALSEQVGEADPYLASHGRQVGELAGKIARQMGKPEDYQENLYYMALLHDYGMSGVSSEILTKKGDLSEAEREEIRKHTLSHGDFFKAMKELPEIAKGARWHHERYDGSGYPDGLKGEAIPESARILAVADVYQAMISDRSYRKALTKEQAKDEISRGRGILYDPEAADALLELIENRAV